MRNIKELTLVLTAAVLTAVTGLTAANAQRFKVKCVDNLKTLRTAAILYEADHDGVIPPVVLPVKKHAVFWPNRLVRYLSTRVEVFYCPEDEKKGAKMLDVPDLLPIAFSPKAMSYGMNYFIGDVGKARPKQKTGDYRVSKIKNPSYVVYFGDAKHLRLRPTKACWQEDYAPRHKDGSNFAFVDGHVEWMDHHTLGLLGPQDDGKNWKIDRKRWLLE